jgi:hypothetical protein
MAEFVTHTVTSVKRNVAAGDNDRPKALCNKFHMKKRSKPHGAKRSAQTVLEIPPLGSDLRIPTHYLAEWLDHLGMRQAKLAELIEMPPGSVSRWASGKPMEWPNVLKISKALGFKDPRLLFKHPDEAWAMDFMGGRDAEEVERIKTAMAAIFPRKVPTKN